MQLKPSYDILIFLNFNIAKTNTTVKIVHLYDKEALQRHLIHSCYNLNNNNNDDNNNN